MTIEKLPASPDAERWILGTVVLDGSRFIEVEGELQTEDFSLEKHQRIFNAMKELHREDHEIDRITLASCLQLHNELDAVGGLTYLCELDSGLPLLPHIDEYIRLVREKSILRRMARIGQNMMNRALQEIEEPDTILSSTVNQLLGVESQKRAEWVTVGDIIRNFPGGWEAFISPDAAGAQTGIGFPWPRLQWLCGGMQNGQLVVGAGRPGSGKSAMATQIATYAAEAGYGVLYTSLEMTGAALVRRQLAQHAQVDSVRMKRGALGESERRRLVDARRVVVTLPLWLEEHQPRGRTAAAIIASVRHQMARAERRHEDLKGWLAVVDHMHLVEGKESVERERYSRIIDTFQRGARDLGCVMLVLAQLSRRCEEERREPGMTDLKETSNIEQDADLVLFVHRPELYANGRNRPELKGIAKLIVGKQRDGATGYADLQFVHSQVRFDSLEGEN